MTEDEIKHLFYSRPARTQPCPGCQPCSRCDGSGIDQIRYSLIYSDKPVKDAPAGSIPAHARAGSDIYECVGEASIFSKQVGTPIAFEFNELIVVVKPTDDPELIARDWWVRRYKETPEQSWAKR